MVVLLTRCHHPVQELVDVGIGSRVGEADVLHGDEVDVLALDELERLVQIALAEGFALCLLQTEGEQGKVAPERA